MREGFCAAGITLRHLRRVLLQDLQTNPAVLKAVENAAGGSLISSLGAIAMSRHGSDLNIAFEAPDDQAGRLWLDVQIDELRGGDISLFDPERRPKVRRDRDGPARQVTIAPDIWFYHRGNAASAVNALMFEKLWEVASGPLRSALDQGTMRAQNKFKALRRAKRPVPRWVYAPR